MFEIKNIEKSTFSVNNIKISPDSPNEIIQEVLTIIKTNKEEVRISDMKRGDLIEIIRIIGTDFKTFLEYSTQFWFVNSYFDNSFTPSAPFSIKIEKCVSEQELIEDIIKKHGDKIKELEIISDLMVGYFQPTPLPILETCVLRGRGTLSFFMRVIAIYSHELVYLEILDYSNVALSLLDMRILGSIQLPKIKTIKLDGVGIGKLFARIFSGPSKDLENVSVKDMSRAGLHYSQQVPKNIIQVPCIYFIKLMRSLVVRHFMREQSFLNGEKRKIKTLELSGNGSSRFFAGLISYAPNIETLKITDPIGYNEGMFKARLKDLKECVLIGDYASETIFKYGLPETANKNFFTSMQ